MTDKENEKNEKLFIGEGSYGVYGAYINNPILSDNDNINHPIHYNSSPAHCECGRKIECIDVTRHMSFNIGNVIKYLWRFQHKNGIKDLKKARWYLDDIIKQMEK